MLSIPKVLNQRLRNALKSIIETYQSKDEKDKPNGYIGANEDGLLNPSQIATDADNRFVSDTNISNWNGKQDEIFDGDFLAFNPENGFFYHDSFMQNATPNTGNLVATTAGNGTSSANLIALNGISLAQVSRPAVYITSNLQGSAVLRYTRVSCRLGVGCTIQQEAHVSLRASTATGYTSIYVGLDSSGTATSIPANDVLTGSGLFWRWNPTLNSGKWQLIKVITGTITPLLNTNYTITDDIIYKLGIKYIKSTDTAYFYYNKTLIHTQASITMPNNIELYDVIAVNTSNPQAVNKMIHWHQLNGLIKYA